MKHSLNFRPDVNSTQNRFKSRNLFVWENDGGDQNWIEEFVLINGKITNGLFAKTWSRVHQYLKTQEGVKMKMQLTEPHEILADGAAISIGLTLDQRKELSEGLSFVLADTYALYLKTQYFHWNVSGDRFISLHLMFEQQYKQLAEAVDKLAERIRAIGFFAPGTFTQFLAMTSLPEEQKPENADEMIRRLVNGHELTIKSLNKLSSLSQSFPDEPTLDLTTQRMAEHEKNAWMLRSLLN